VDVGKWQSGDLLRLKKRSGFELDSLRLQNLRRSSHLLSFSKASPTVTSLTVDSPGIIEYLKCFGCSV
jgi:hypothetical protein